MKKMKKLLSVLLAAAIMISTLCIGTVSAGAAQRVITESDADNAIAWGKNVNFYTGYNGKSFKNRCLAFVYRCYYYGCGIDIYNGGSGYSTAKAFGNDIISNTTDRKPPKGALVFLDTSNSAEHIGISTGDGKFIHAWTNGIRIDNISDYKFWGWGVPKGHTLDTSSYYTVGETRKVTTKSGLTIRSGTGTGYSKVGAIPYGKEFTVTTYPISKNGYQWCYTETQWGSGYVVYDKYSSYVSGDIFPQGSFKLSPKCAPDSSITVAGKSYANETILHLWENHTDGSCGCMTWYFEPVSYNNRTGEIYYAIRNQRSGLAIDINIYNSSVQQYEPHYGDNQLFKLVPVGDGYYRIESMYGYSLDIQSGYSDNGTLVILWYNDNYDSAQLFRLYE